MTTEATLTLTLRFGNEAMATASDAAEVMRSVADVLESGTTVGTLLDNNGNTVGEWRINIPEDDA